MGKGINTTLDEGQTPIVTGGCFKAFDPQSGGDLRGLELKDTAQLQRSQVPDVVCATGERTHALTRSPGVTEDGTGRGTPITPSVAGTLSSRSTAGGGLGTDFDLAGGLQVHACNDNQSHDTVEQGGIRHGDAKETGPREVLRALRQEIGEKAFAEWGVGILASFFSSEVLRKAMHGSGLRCPSIEEFGLVNYALSRPQDCASRAMRQLRQTLGARCSSSGWQSHEQRAIQLGAYLSKLSQPGTSAASIMQDLLEANEGPGILQQALSKIQEVGQSVHDKAEPARTSLSVRRLVPVECEFLMGFPRDYTRIPWKKRPAEDCPDGPRYKALGNSMAVPVMRWIGQRLQAVEEA